MTSPSRVRWHIGPALPDRLLHPDAQPRHEADLYWHDSVARHGMPGERLTVVLPPLSLYQAIVLLATLPVIMSQCISGSGPLLFSCSLCFRPHSANFMSGCSLEQGCYVCNTTGLHGMHFRNAVKQIDVASIV